MTEFDIPAGVRAVEVDANVLPVIEAAKKVVHFVKPTKALIGWQGVQAELSVGDGRVVVVE